MHFLRKNWQLVSAIAVMLVLAVALGVGYTVQSQAAETEIETAEFFTVPVHVLLPNEGYVKSYRVQTNELVSLRSMLAYNDIATFSDEAILKVNEYDHEQKLVKTFAAQPETPFYARVVAKDKSLLGYYEAITKPTTQLAESYMAKNGIEIIIEQQYYQESTGETAFLTNAEIQASLKAKAIQFAEMTGYYDEYGNWIVDEPESDEWTLELDDVMTICSANQVLVDGVCELKNPTITENDSTTDYPTTDDSGSGNVVTPTPTPTPTPDPTPTPPVCGADEILVGNECQPKPEPPQPEVPVCGADEILVGNECQPKPPVCNEDEELIGGVCQPKPLPDKPEPEQLLIPGRKPESA